MLRKWSDLFISPTLVTFLFLLVIILWVILIAGGDPLALARLGTRFSQGDLSGSEGYDGQFIYYIARNPAPQEVAKYLDVPAYRYQRILLPIAARILSFGQPTWLPWVLALLVILSQLFGTWSVSELLAGWGMSRWYALAYGLFAGFILAARLDLSEPLAYGLVAGGILSLNRNKNRLGWILLGLSLFAKEVVILFVLALLIEYLTERQWKASLSFSLMALLPFIVFQIWLWKTFGTPGISSGGAMATSFELIPYMGLLRIAAFSPEYMIAMLIVFGPFVIFPSLWGISKSVKFWMLGERNMIVYALFLNGLAIALLPFSTFREPGGLIRFACGLVLAVLLFAGRYRIRKVLNYSQLWMVLNLFLLKS